MSDAQFDYYYGSEGEQFSFIRIPKLMLLDPKFQALSLKSIILYGFLLDRMNLSMRRGWLDEDNRVYIRFRIKEIMEDMNDCEKTAIGYLAELEKIGLVEKDKKGMGMGNKLYVKNFISPDLRSKAFITSKKYSNGENESTSINRNFVQNVDNSENGEVCKASKINITVENGGNGTVDIYSNETVETAGNQKRVTSKETAPDNEKYAFRCFLLKLGFRNFEGSSAFKSGAKKEYSPGCDRFPHRKTRCPLMSRKRRNG